MDNKQLQNAVHEISYHRGNRLELFQKLDISDRSRVLLRLSKTLQKELFGNMAFEEQVQIVERLDPNDATDLLQLLDTGKRTSILKKVQTEIQDEITTLLEFDPNSAAGLMSLDYVQADESQTIRDIIEKVRVHEKRTGRIPTILIQAKNELAGYLPMHQLALSPGNDKVGKHVKHIDTILHSANSKEVEELIQQNPHEVLAVLKEGKILGVIYSDDVLKVLHSQSAKGLYSFAGLDQEETVFDSTARKFYSRYKWLIINLGTAFLASFTVSFFEGTIAKHVLLAVYMPIVAGMGGNAATQTLAVMVRGISQNKLPWWRVLFALKSEVLASILNGLINGAIVFVIVVTFNRDIMLALVLAVAMIINLIIAATFGTLIPVLMQKLGKDPASSATIFITTATDVFGFLAFLGLAALLLS
jgi:magnesium transporter